MGGGCLVGCEKGFLEVGGIFFLSVLLFLSLFLLFIGISLVQVQNLISITPKQDVNAAYGLIAVVSGCKFKAKLKIKCF